MILEPEAIGKPQEQCASCSYRDADGYCWEKSEHRPDFASCSSFDLKPPAPQPLEGGFDIAGNIVVTEAYRYEHEDLLTIKARVTNGQWKDYSIIVACELEWETFHITDADLNLSPVVDQLISGTFTKLLRALWVEPFEVQGKRNRWLKDRLDLPELIGRRCWAQLQDHEWTFEGGPQFHNPPMPKQQGAQFPSGFYPQCERCHANCKAPGVCKDCETKERLLTLPPAPPCGLPATPPAAD